MAFGNCQVRYHIECLIIESLISDHGIVFPRYSDSHYSKFPTIIILFYNMLAHGRGITLGTGKYNLKYKEIYKQCVCHMDTLCCVITDFHKYFQFFNCVNYADLCMQVLLESVDCVSYDYCCELSGCLKFHPTLQKQIRLCAWMTIHHLARFHRIW